MPTFNITVNATAQVEAENEGLAYEKVRRALRRMYHDVLFFVSVFEDGAEAEPLPDTEREWFERHGEGKHARFGTVWDFPLTLDEHELTLTVWFNDSPEAEGDFVNQPWNMRIFDGHPDTPDDELEGWDFSGYQSPLDPLGLFGFGLDKLREHYGAEAVEAALAAAKEG